MKELDRKRPYSSVQGDSRAKYYQAGTYFYADGTEIKPEDAGKPSDTGSFANQVAAGVAEAQAKENAKKPLKLIDETNPHTKSQAQIDAARARASREKPAEPEVVAEAQTDERVAILKKMHVNELRRMVATAGLTPATGRGSKQKNIDLLLENTE